MRNGHNNNKNNRMRNRNNRGNKSSNPLTTAYDSVGPGIKVRGTAQHIAEKYISLARDAQGSGDYIAYEGYMQHAEHYIRLVVAAHEHMRGINPNWRPDKPLPGQVMEDIEDDEDDLEGDGQAPQAHQPRRVYDADGEQPEGSEGDFAPQNYEQPRRFQRPPRNEQRHDSREPRQEGGQEEGGEEGQFNRRPPRGRFNRFNRGKFQPQEGGEGQPQAFQREHAPNREQQPRGEDGQESFGLPAFLTQSVAPVVSTPREEGGEAPAPRRAPRRPRREEEAPQTVVGE